jgi:tetratricopeptide (TPR) repeat protein
MVPSREDDVVVPFPITRQERARQWRRTAWAMAALFASLPIACKIFVGTWGFDEAFEVAGLCAILGTYFHILSRRSLPAVPDDATVLDRGMRLAHEGKPEAAIKLFTNAIRLSPRLWQAFQYRGELHLLDPDATQLALQDFNEAIRIAPGEPHLYVLRAQTHRLMGDELSARNDADMATRCQTGRPSVIHRIDDLRNSGNPASGA